VHNYEIVERRPAIKGLENVGFPNEEGELRFECRVAVIIAVTRRWQFARLGKCAILSPFGLVAPASRDHESRSRPRTFSCRSGLTLVSMNQPQLDHKVLEVRVPNSIAAFQNDSIVSLLNQHARVA